METQDQNETQAAGAASYCNDLLGVRARLKNGEAQMTPFFISFVVCVILALIQLPGVMNGSLISIAGMAFCSAMALWNLVMGAAFLSR